MGGVDDKSANTNVEVEAFSFIKFFAVFEKAVEKFNTYPLTLENLVVQKDAYQRLAADDSMDYHEPVATLDCSRKEKDNDLRFMIELAPAGAAFHIEGIGLLFFEYTWHFDDELDAARQLMLFAKLLANGQIASLVTLREDKVCATEMLLYPQGPQNPTVIYVAAKYSWWWPNDVRDDASYETLLMRNHYSYEQHEVPGKFFLLAAMDPGSEWLRRQLKPGEVTPLTKPLYKMLKREAAKNRSNESYRSIWSLLYRSPETWVVAAATGTLYWLLVQKVLPEGLMEDIAIGPLAAGFTATCLAIWVLALKERLQQSQPDHIWIRASSYISKHGFLLFRLLVAIGMLATVFMPLFVLPGHKDVINLFEVATTAEWALIVPGMSMLTVLASFWRTKKGLLGYCVLLVGSLAGIIAVNFGITDPDAETPEPFLTFSILLYFVIVPALVIKIVRHLKKAKS